MSKLKAYDFLKKLSFYHIWYFIVVYVI